MCLFCKIASKEIPARVVHEDDDVVAFADIHPAAPTHLLVIPRRHVASLADTSPADQALLGKIVATAARLAREAGLAETGYRTVMNTGPDAGQSVFHLHLHVLGGRPMAWPPG